MVEISEKKGMGKTKVLTSQSAIESRSVDPNAQVLADEVKGKKLQGEAECSVAPQKRVTSHMLLDKFQRDREKQQSKEEEMHRKEEH
jgi:hypothetical protein